MKKIIAALAATAALALGGCVDRGKCLSSTTVHHEGFFYTTYVPGPNNTMTPIMQYMPDSDEEVCTTWEFPDGRPKGNK